MAVAPALRAHMMGTALGGALGSVQYMLWAAVSKCYARSAVGAHLGALILMLLTSPATD
jgi:hypothetical protein